MKLEYRDFEAMFAKLLEKFSVRFNPVSLVEAKWIVLRLSRKNLDQRDALFRSYRAGLLSLEKDSMLQKTPITNSAIEESSDALLTKFNLVDYFDRQIYSTAVYLDSIFLTEDDRLHEAFKKPDNQYKPRSLMKWKELLQEIMK